MYVVYNPVWLKEVLSEHVVLNTKRSFEKTSFRCPTSISREIIEIIDISLVVGALLPPP